MERSTAGAASTKWPAVKGDEPFCYLETIGRVSGRPHTVEMWFAADDRTIYLMSGGRDRSDWVKNLVKYPTVRVRVGAVTYAGTASVVDGTPDQQPAREALAAKYYRWREGPLPNQWTREALPVAIRLDGVAE